MFEYCIRRKEELKDKVKKLEDSVKYWQDTSQNYIGQIKSPEECEIVKKGSKEC